VTIQPTTEDDQGIRAYLLGAELPAGAQDRIEKNLIEDDDYLERMLSIEDEIADSYIGGELTPDEIVLFKRNFVKPSQRREKLLLFESWIRACSRPNIAPRAIMGSPKGATSWWKSMVAAMSKHRSLAFASALGVLMVFGAWLIRRDLALQAANRQISSQLANDNREKTNLEKQLGASSRERAQTIASFVLTPSGTRGGGGTKSSSVVAIHSGIEVLRLELPVSGREVGIYSVLIEAVEGQEIFREDHLATEMTPSGSVVNLLVPASLLNPNDYLVVLRHMQSDGMLHVIESFPIRVVQD